MYASVLSAFVLLRFVLKLIRVLLTNNRSCLSMCSSRAAFAHRSEDETSKLPRPRGYKPTAFRPAGWQGYESAGTDDDADDEFSSLLNAAGAPTAAAAATPATAAPAAAPAWRWGGFVRSTRRAHHVGSTGDSGEIEDAI
jgi:hypothetical protein